MKMDHQVKNPSGVHKQCDGKPEYHRMSQVKADHAHKAFPGSPEKPGKMAMPPCRQNGMV